MRHIFLLILLLTSIRVSAEVVPFDLVIVKRSDITTNQQLQIFQESIKRLQEVGVTIRLDSIHEVEDVVNKNEFADYVNRRDDWAKWALKNKIRNQKKHIHFLLPPVILKGVSYMGGASGAVCTTTINLSKKYSYSIVRLKNDAGQNRYQESLIAVAHEILHNLGANHRDDVPNMMHEAAMQYGPTFGFKNLLIHPITKRQVNYCKQRRTPAGKYVRSRSLISSSENDEYFLIN